MDSLDFNLHQLILSDLALNTCTASNDEESLQSGIDLIASRVVLRSTQVGDETKSGTQDGTSNGVEVQDQERVYISASKVHCHIAYGQLAVNLPAGHLESAIPVLIAILRDVPYVQFDPSLNWIDWALSDQLVYSTVTALLRLASRDGTPREHIIGSIISFTCDIVSLIKGTGEVISHAAPAFHGLYRAVISTSFSWSITEWLRLSQALSDLLDADLVEHFGDHLTAAIDSPREQAILSRYIAANRPLTGYFILCCIMEIEWTVLAQNLQTAQVCIAPTGETGEEAAAANAAWGALASKKVASPPQVTRDIGEGLRKSIDVAMQCFTDLLTQMESLETEPSSDTYAWETMAESIKLAAVCSVALQEIDQGLLSRIRLLLSESSPVYDSLVQEAALEAAIVLLHNFKSIAPSMASHLRKFISNPLSIFEFHLIEETHAPTLLLAIAQCLALSIQLSPGDDLVMSTMYSLLNFIAVTSKEQGIALRGEKAKEARDDMHIAFGTYTDDEKRILGISTICVVTHLALEVKKEEVTRLTISMLLQHIRTAEPSVEAAIAFNLVHLALVAPQDAFVDIIRAFCFINRTTRIGEGRQLNDMVLAAQTRLAQKMSRRPDLYNVYLLEILALFADKGVAIQTATAANATENEMKNLMEELCSLLLPIDALLDHKDFHPHHDPSSLLTTRFRNMWFICVLFNFTQSPQRASCMTDWHIGALSRIAEKTPPIVLEEAYDFITTDLEFNPVLREDYLEKTAAMHKATLTKYIPLKASDVKALIPAQVIFLLTLHDLEAMRSSRGYVASITTYFLNKGVNSRESLSSCLDSIAEKVMRGCLNELNTRVMQHSLPVTIPSELQKLLVASCHRIARARDIAGKYLHRMITSLPSLMCDEPLVCAILEVLTLLRHACEGEYTDEYNPVHHFTSARSNLTIELTGSYAARNEILALLHKNANHWLTLGISRAPIEVRRTLQKYLAFHDSIILPDVTELGAALALQYACRIQPDERSIVPISGPLAWTPDRSKVFAAQLAAQERFTGEARGIRLATKGVGTEQIHQMPPPQAPSVEINALITKLKSVADEIHHHTSKMTMQDFKRLLFRTASALITIPESSELVQELVALPFVAFTPTSIAAGIEAWTWLIGERPDLEISLMTDISEAWAETIKLRKGLFSTSMNFDDPFNHPVEYSATDRVLIDRTVTTGKKLLGPHTQLLRMLLSRFQAVRYRRPGLMLLITRLVLRTTKSHKSFSTHPLARGARFSFLIFGFEVLKSSFMDTDSEARLRDGLYKTALSWFAVRPQWSYGANRVQIDADIKILNEFLDSLQADAVRGMSIISSRDVGAEASMGPEYFSQLKSINTLLRLLVENEIFRLNVWNNPSSDKRSNDQTSGIERNFTESSWANAVRMAWTIDPAVAVHLAERFKQPIVRNEVAKHIKNDPKAALDVSEALSFLLGDRLNPSIRKSLTFLHLWRPVPPVLAISYFSPRYGNDSIVLQYAHRVLAGHPVHLTFFFVPQVVQALRHDPLGYVERFIFETAKISQLFCHQIIWNMKANCYKDDAGEIEDPMKPMLDRMTEMVVESLSGDAREFYDREFGFFNEVTSISGKLKPFIKRTKQEKKVKIDEEMAKIVVKVGVYLPSNPDGRVVDIDKKSGRPLQSHAKAPFMATFKVRKEKIEVIADPNAVIEGGEGTEKRTECDVLVQAIFKVGDDCRQDVLALQVIAMFKNIFTSVGLTLFVLPYRVTATGPGMGVIDVVPNATSRDEMGRAKINDLLAFFIAKFGSEDTVAYQQARLNFIQSMAAYSVVCYILQIKDRHNGNIMIDGHGHIVHIDFGFLFDIAPGGVKFEPNSFKLNREMVVLMGGRASEGYALFTQLTIKAFLAIRPHASQIVEAVHLMLGTGLPSFKGEPTIRRLRDRFALHLNERQAAEWMTSVIRNAYENVRSTIYDEFQRVQNGIPYA